MSQEDAYSFESMLSLIRVWVLLAIEPPDRTVKKHSDICFAMPPIRINISKWISKSKVLKVKLLAFQIVQLVIPASPRYAEVYRPDLGQSTILRQASPEFHAAVVETGGFEAFARSSTLVSKKLGLKGDSEPW